MVWAEFLDNVRLAETFSKTVSYLGFRFTIVTWTLTQFFEIRDARQNVIIIRSVVA